MAAPYSLYVDLPLRQMRASYDDLGLHGLSNTILELEGTHAISPNSSRILDSGDYRGNAEFLLAQIPEGMLTSILSNTLPADVASRRPILEQWSTISPHPQHKDTLEPGIYANYLAPKNGSALSLVEFQYFLDGLEAAVSGTLMNGTNVGSKVDVNDDITMTLLRRPNEVLSSNAIKVGDGSDQIGRYAPFATGLGAAVTKRFAEELVSIICVANDERYEQLPKDVNKTGCMYNKMLRGGAQPDDEWACPLCVKANRICLKKGKISANRVDISVNSAIIANAKLWLTVCTQYEDVIDYAHQTVLADRRMFEAKVQRLEEEIERRQKLDKLAKLQEELDELLEQADDNSLHIAVREETKKVNGLERVFQKQEGEVKKCHDNLSTLAADFQLLEVAPSTISSAVLHHNSGSDSSNAEEGVRVS
ncbi:hypothetical protein KCU64_g458, partial [Aureobasidium melanogenum]